MRTAMNQPEVEVMMESVGIRISVRGMMPAIMARRVSSVTRRSTGPITKPMNRSMPVHSAPVMTWTKSRNHRLGDRIAAVITAKARPAAATYQARNGDATRACGWLGAVCVKEESLAAVASANREASERGWTCQGVSSAKNQERTSADGSPGPGQRQLRRAAAGRGASGGGSLAEV